MGTQNGNTPHEPLPTEYATSPTTGEPLRLVSCRCAWKGIYWPTETKAQAAHRRHVALVTGDLETEEALTRALDRDSDHPAAALLARLDGAA